MAKFYEASEEITAIVEKVADEIGMDQILDFEALNVPKAKDVVTIMKASAMAEYLSKRDDLIIVAVREDAFDRVDDETKYMWIRMAMDVISYDYDKDKVNLTAPTITVPVGFYDKYKEKAVNSALLGKYTIAQIEDEEKEKKAANAAKKKKGKEE